MSQQPLKVGVIGGGGDAFIIHPHEKAIHFDGTRRVVCAALSSDPARSLRLAAEWPYPIQGYHSYDEMIAEEAKKPRGERIDYALIVTPNNVHYDPAMKCIETGIPVFLEKPITLNLDEATRLARKVKEKKIPLGVAHTYLGHWTSLFSRYIVRSGLLGDVRWVDAYYIQGWLADRTEDKGVRQAEWRVDPKRAGLSGAGGDIGTHALMQLRFVTGLEVTELIGLCEKYVTGRAIDDHFTVNVKLSNGGRGLVRASQICIGHLNDLGIEVNGTKGSLIWRQEEPEKVIIRLPGQPDRVYYRAAVSANDGFLGDVPAWLLAEPTIPSGHPEAFHDAFARLHRYFEKDVRAYNEGKPFEGDGSKYATIEDGWVGMAFVTAAVESSAKGNVWTKMPRLD